MAEETQYTAETPCVKISTGNNNLDGTGTLGSLVSSSVTNGKLIKSVYIKALGDTTQGMIRLFSCTEGNSRLLKEIEIPAIKSSAIDTTFEAKIEMDLTLPNIYSLTVSTERSEDFNIVGEYMNWAYYATSVRTDTTKYTAVTGETTITTADAKALLITAGGLGCSIESITIKAEGNTTDGIIDIFIFDADNRVYVLFKQIKVTAVTKSGIAHSYEYNLVFENDFELKAGYSLYVATKQTQTFSVIAEGLNWDYLA